MPMIDKACIEAIKGELQSKGFDLSKADKTSEFIEVIVKNVLLEVKKATITTPMGPGSIS